jgi:predicted N-acetyltransferase YhbS
MSTSEVPSARVRRAQAGDVEAILDLLTHYDLPRQAFEPFYRDDPTYRPEDSWVVEQDGRLVAHLRIYDRTLYLGEARLRVAGVGNVITDRAERGRGWAGQLLEGVLAALPGEGYPYSLPWTHLPALYARYGWAPIAQDLARATLPPPDAAAPPLAPFTLSDLPAVERLYAATNTARSGPVVRSDAYWQGQLAWLDEDRAGFLLARAADGRLAGYVRRRVQPDAVEILELGLQGGDWAVGRALLAAAAEPRGGRVITHLPPSLLPLLPPGSEEATDMGLMGRVLDLGALTAALAPRWQASLPAAGVREGAVALDTRAGRAVLQVSADSVTLSATPGATATPALDERALAHLLFHGADAAAQTFLDGRPDAALLEALFPAQDFVIWPADAF